MEVVESYVYYLEGTDGTLATKLLEGPGYPKLVLFFWGHMPKLGPNNSGSGIFAWYYDLTLIHGRYFYYVVIHTAEELFYLLYPGLFLGGLLKGDMCHGLGVILYNGQPGHNCSKFEDSHIGWKIPILPFRTGIRWFHSLEYQTCKTCWSWNYNRFNFNPWTLVVKMLEGLNWLCYRAYSWYNIVGAVASRFLNVGTVHILTFRQGQKLGCWNSARRLCFFATAIKSRSTISQTKTEETIPSAPNTLLEGV